MAGRKDILLGKLRSGAPMSGGEQFKLTLLLAWPSILAQLSMCLMSYIDAAMVGRLGSAQAAAIGLVSTTTWIFGSFCYANSSGFSVQIAHRCGAKDFTGARRIFRHGIFVTVALSVLLALLAVAIHRALPHWLGGSPEILSDASAYFLIYALFLPLFQVTIFSEASLIASGNVQVPGIVSIAMCVLDVFFNYLFIFVLDLGVKGAALGTGLATACAGAFLLVYVLHRSEELRQREGLLRPARRLLGNIRTLRTDARTAESLFDAGQRDIFKQAFGISWPLWIQNLISRGAYIAATVLVAPLGTIAIAANSFAIIAEGFCYLPGYGMQDAATTLVGQSLGARRPDTARRFAWMAIGSGASMMTVLAVLMWVFAPQVMGLLSRDPEVISLGAQCLRIEAWAELLYGVSIVAYGCCVGAGDTLVPSVINLLSMWVIRLGLALFLIPRYGLPGYWVAMAVELSVKGVIFAVRIARGRWMKTKLTGSLV
ncbi:MAG: MATE family efflux transporter [Bacteroidales bacterium]|nr:MATE family efflux transporter [Bacteroidales bacterium]